MMKIVELKLVGLSWEWGVPLVGYFKREQEKFRKRMNTDVAFTQEYSRVSIFMGNVKCTRRIRNV
jgi:hypothetical protein